MGTIFGEDGRPALRFLPAVRPTLRLAVASLLCAVALSGCVQGPNVALPTLGKDARPVLTAEQQKAATQELSAQKDAEHAAALKKIETK